MLRRLFYEHSPIILGIAGALTGIGGFIMDEVSLFTDETLWLWVALIQGLSGAYCGVLMRRLMVTANTDSLTRLWNRRYIRWKVAEELAMVQRYGRQMCVAMVDIDGFKQMNDMYGHMAGDEVLIELAAIFRKNMRKVDTVARLGGDEFMIIFPETGAAGAVSVAERIRRAVEVKFAARNVSASIGVIVVSKDMDMIEVFSEADKALYEAKKNKNDVYVAVSRAG